MLKANVYEVGKKLGNYYLGLFWWTVLYVWSFLPFCNPITLLVCKLHFVSFQALLLCSSMSAMYPLSTYSRSILTCTPAAYGIDQRKKASNSHQLDDTTAKAKKKQTTSSIIRHRQQQTEAASVEMASILLVA